MRIVADIGGLSGPASIPRRYHVTLSNGEKKHLFGRTLSESRVVRLKAFHRPNKKTLATAAKRSLVVVPAWKSWKRFEAARKLTSQQTRLVSSFLFSRSTRQICSLCSLRGTVIEFVPSCSKYDLSVVSYYNTSHTPRHLRRLEDEAKVDSVDVPKRRNAANEFPTRALFSTYQKIEKQMRASKRRARGGR